jgi:hypothetical protein
MVAHCTMLLRISFVLLLSPSAAPDFFSCGQKNIDRRKRNPTRHTKRLIFNLRFCPRLLGIGNPARAVKDTFQNFLFFRSKTVRFFATRCESWIADSEDRKQRQALQFKLRLSYGCRICARYTVSLRRVKPRSDGNRFVTFADDSPTTLNFSG